MLQITHNGQQHSDSECFLLYEQMTCSHDAGKQLNDPHVKANKTVTHWLANRMVFCIIFVTLQIVRIQVYSSFTCP